MNKPFIVQIDIDLQEILPKFIENRQKDLEMIKIYLENKDLIKIEVIAHKLAGNAGSYGFTHLGKIGLELEAACQSADLNTIKSKYEEYLNYMKFVQVEFV